MIDVNDSVQKEIEYCKKELSVLQDEREVLIKRNDKANSEIQFLKGKIDAYEYVLNCRLR